jgi:hypothetical protein
MTPKGNSRANGISERESNNEANCEADCNVARHNLAGALLSDNKIQLKFRTKDFEGEYFHYTGDLFFIYKSGHLMKLMCQKRES